MQHLLYLPPVDSTTISETDPEPPDIYTLSLHDALPISKSRPAARAAVRPGPVNAKPLHARRNDRQQRVRIPRPDRKSTRLNSSHVASSYAVFRLINRSTHKRTAHSLRTQIAGAATTNT